MKLLCISDLHGKAGEIEGLGSVDALVICGDITHFEGRKRAIEMLDYFKAAKKILAVPGNCDTMEVNETLDELSFTLHKKGRMVGNVGFFGVGGSNSTPFNTPQEYSEKELENFILKGYGEVKDSLVTVMVSHTPPCNTKVDDTGSMHVGSTKVREFIERNGPDLVLCGHVHEAQGKDSIGKSVIVNPGLLGGGHAIIEVGRKIEVEFFKS